ncbi:MAG: putative manganese-dependent inorganic diphosphatase [Roseburia hominis]|uniref:putative manganese-dependent inorganic diphosphatase n=1 Tax=Roseburia hominis TaxID=301301 RepID=UPI0026EA554A|nr:putative manganese-dependent inorganic diphosphatase [Roseburia hominis]MCI7523121.1 putative manganese-dependent inorganic diphosphatase [Roseburia hominis]MDD6242872.1 putative manganese-dependent inorganic diphosphatase [Roseburia hominis]
MSTESKKVWVVGHKNPDTDSICAAISYAYLKNQSGDKKTYVAKRAGAVNEETRYVLERFGVEEPPLVTYAGAQLKDINIRKTAGVSNQISLKRAWELMKKLEVVTLPVTNQFGKLEGVIVTKDIATSYMDVLDNCVLSKARTQYKTIAETIDGEVYAGNEHAHFVRGKVVIATSNPEYMADYIEDDDLVILGDREEAQMQAIRSNASCIIIGGGLEVAEEVKKLAEKRDCVIITTPFDTFSVARLINQSMPIKQYMTRRDLVTFDIDDYVDDVKDVMSRVRHRDFPVLGSNGNYVGMISRRNLMNMQKKQVILVDHNEKSQAVDGIGEAEILEIIDHHRLGSLETVSPVYFRNQPLGCTSTIIYQMYQEQGVEIPKEIAGLLLSAIISDTLMFRSPTCTPLDKSVAERLAEIADVDIEDHAKKMFRAGSDFKNKTTEEIFYQDFKIFHTEDCDFGVAQISAMSGEELDQIGEQLRPFLPQVLGEKRLNMVYVMLTDILEESSKIIFAGEDAGKILAHAFKKQEDADGILLDGIISRKKQMIPTLMNEMSERA